MKKQMVTIYKGESPINITILKDPEQLWDALRYATERGMLHRPFTAQSAADYLKANNFLNPDGSHLPCEQVNRVCFSQTVFADSNENQIRDKSEEYDPVKSYQYSFTYQDYYGPIPTPDDAASLESYDSKASRRKRNRQRLIDVAIELCNGGKVPKPFSSEDLKAGLYEANHTKEDGVPFELSYIHNLLWNLFSQPHEIGSCGLYLELRAVSKHKSYKYVFVEGNWKQSLVINLAEIVYNGIFQGLLKEEFTAEEAYNFLVEVGEVKPGDFSSTAIGIYLQEASMRLVVSPTGWKSLHIHDSEDGITYSFSPQSE